MKVARICSFLILAGAIYLWAAPVETQDRDKQSQLVILSATPSGPTNSISDSRNIVVTFNQPMVGIQALAEGPGDILLTIKPEVAGTYQWLGTSTLAFVPSDTLPFATRFDVTVPGGTKSLSGQSLKYDYSWFFETPRPRLVYHYPQDGATAALLDQEVTFYFNIPMSVERARPFIRLTDTKAVRSLPFTLRQPTSEDIKRDWRARGDTSRVLILKPLGELARKTYHRVELKQGLLAAEGGLGMAEAVSFRFETYGDLEFKGLQTPVQHNPQEPVVFHFTNPVTYAELVNHITFSPPVDIPDYYFDRMHDQPTLHLALPLLPDTLYQITIDGGLTDSFGNKLGRDVRVALTTGPYRKRVIMTTGPGVLEATGDRRYPMQHVNVEEIRLQLARVSPDRLIPFLSDPSLFYSATKQADSFFLVDRRWDVSGKRNVREIRPIEADWLLGGAKYGLAFIQLDNLFPEPDHQILKALLQVTDMGVSAKFSPSNNIIWVARLQDASPVPGAKVEVRGDNNKVLYETETDSQGMATTPGWKQLGIKPPNRWQRPRQWVFVYKDTDFAYTASDWGTGIYPYRFGINYDWRAEPEEFAGMIFTDRNLYRAGETVHVKGIFRRKEDMEWSLPTGYPVVVRVFDSHNEKLFEDSLELTDYGSFSFKVALSESAALGYYRIVADSAGTREPERGGEPLATGSFRVEAFRTAEFEVNVRLNRDDYMAGDSVRADITGRYLFGGGMANQDVDWRVRVSSSGYQPPGHEGHFFGPHVWDLDEGQRFTSRVISSGDTKLDQTGKLEVSASLANLNMLSAGRVTVTADVEGPSRQHIAGTGSAIVHPGEFYIGLQPKSTFREEGEELPYEVIVVRPDGQILSGKLVEVKILRRQYHSVRKVGIGGRYEWISKKVDTVVDSFRLVSGAAPTGLSFTPKESGSYIIRAEGKDDRGNIILSSAQFYVSGKEYAAWERRDDDRIDLVADKKRYSPGNVARVLVKSPFEEAEALVTLEREGILKHYTLHLAGSAPSIEVPIEEAYLPNVFVSVILLKGRTANHVFSEEGEDIGRPAFKIGYVNLEVDPGTRHLKVDVSTQEDSYGPGQEISIAIQLQASSGEAVQGELAVAVVDAGILNLTGYELPDPFDRFYGPRPLSVQTSETRLHVVEQRNYGEKGEDRGGGGAEAKAFAGIDLRTRLVPTAYWNPSVLTDAEGKATVTFTLPDNLTRFKVMVVGQTKKSLFGRGSTEFTVTKPLLLQAALPRFARLGDTFKAGVAIQNFTKREGEVQVQVEVDGIDLKSKPERRVTVGAGQAVELRYPFQVRQVGEATFSFRARMGEHTDGLQVQIPLQEPRLRETVATYSRTANSVEEEITIPKDIYTGLGSLEVWAASTAMSGLSGSVDYLFHYPYGCLEQRVSSILPMILAGDLVRAFDLPALRGRDFADVVTETFAEFPKYQLDNGGFSFWPGGKHDSPYASAYAAYALVQGKQHGYDVDKRILQRVLEYLTNFLRETYGSGQYPYAERAWWCTKALALYVLALADQPEVAYVDRLYETRADLPLFGRALLLKTLSLLGNRENEMEVLVGELLNMIRVSPTSAHFEESDPAGLHWIFHSDLRTTALVLQSLLEARGGFALDEKVVRWMLDHRKIGRWRTTQENVYALHALATYFQTYEKEEPDFTAEIRLAGKTLLKQMFSGRSLETQRTVRLLDDFKKGKKRELEIRKDGRGQLYYGVRMQYYPLEPLETRDQGIAVLKTVTPFADSFWTHEFFRPGGLVKVELRVITPQGRNFVVVDDPLPAGFEAVNMSLKTTSRELRRDLRAERRRERRPRVWWGGFNHTEMRDDRMLLFADYLTAGVHTYTYLARATTIGTFGMPATQVEQMYEPEVFGRLAGKQVAIGNP